MIKQANIGLESRGHASPYLENGFLPLITSNMYSVVGVDNMSLFLNNKINVALPRGIDDVMQSNAWQSVSMEQFESLQKSGNFLIDCANGNNPKLHNAIRKAKYVFGKSIQIMSGNVSSVEAYIELSNAGCDFIRVGVGGSVACNTTRNTGVGQENLGVLIEQCRQADKNAKIVADGISSYVDFCHSKYGFLDNGYAAINSLLYLGADMIMMGKLFAQCQESSAQKIWEGDKLKAVYSGMSTKQAQDKYKQGTLRHSEGNSSLIDVKWTLEEWLYGSELEPDYLPGFVNCLQSAMSYAGKRTMKEFIGCGIKGGTNAIS